MINIRRQTAMPDPKSQLAAARRAVAEAAALTKTTKKPVNLVARIAARLVLPSSATRAKLEAELERRGVTAPAADAYPANWTANGRARLAAPPATEPDDEPAYPANWIQK